MFLSCTMVDNLGNTTGRIDFRYLQFLFSSEKTNMSSESDYPPNGLADSVKKLPEWIQKVNLTSRALSG